MDVYFSNARPHKSLFHHPQIPTFLTATNWTDQLKVLQSFSDDMSFSTSSDTQITTLFCGKFDCEPMLLSGRGGKIWLLVLSTVITRPVNLSLSEGGWRRIDSLIALHL